MFQAMPSRYTNVILTVITFLLAVLAFRPVAHPAPVLAQADDARYYFEPGTVGIRNPTGGSEGEGKLVVDLRTGDIWAFPTLLAGRGVPYPIDVNSSKPPTVKPVLLGRFDLSAMKRVP
jgi:hypothetical protein